MYISEVILQDMYHIRKNAHTNLIYSIQTNISDSWGFEEGLDVALLFTIKFTLFVFWLFKVSRVTWKQRYAARFFDAFALP